MFIKNNKGFTLAEVLVTITVIGIVVALLLPLANKMKPDPLKIKYLKTYDAITEISSNLAKNQNIFPGFTIINDETYLHQRFPFLMKSQKFCENFAVGINAVEQTLTVNGDNATVSFNTKNGIAWTINSESSINVSEGTGEYLSIINIWLDGNRENMASNNHHSFVNTADGQIYINDESGELYRATRNNWLKRSSNNIQFNPPDPDTLCVINFENIYTDNSGSVNDDTSGSVNDDTSGSVNDNTSGSVNDNTSGNSEYEDQYNDRYEQDDYYLDRDRDEGYDYW